MWAGEVWGVLLPWRRLDSMCTRRSDFQYTAGGLGVGGGFSGVLYTHNGKGLSCSRWEYQVCELPYPCLCRANPLHVSSVCSPLAGHVVDCRPAGLPRTQPLLYRPSDLLHKLKQTASCPERYETICWYNANGGWGRTQGQ